MANKKQRDTLIRMFVPEQYHKHFNLDTEDDTLDMEDEDADADGDADIDHLPGRQKRDKAEQRDRQLAETTRRLARSEGVILDDLRQQATHGSVPAQMQASAKIADLMQRAARLVESQRRKPVQSARLDEGELVDEVRYLAEYDDGLDLDELRHQAERGTREEQIAAAAKIQGLYQRAAQYLSE